MDVSFVDIDNIIKEVAPCFERGSKLKIEQLSHSDLRSVDKDISLLMEGRIKHVLDSCSDKLSLAKEVNLKSEFKRLIGAFVYYCAQNNRAPRVIPSKLPDLKEVSSKYSTLAPFLVSRMSKGRVGLLSARSSSKSTLWFAATDMDNAGFNCLDFKGNTKRVEDSALVRMGYSRVEASQRQLTKACKAEIHSGISSNEVKLVGLFVGLNILSKEEVNSANKKLDNLLAILPDSRRIKNKPAEQKIGL